MRTCREPCRMQLTETDHLWYAGNTPGWKWAPESASLSGTDAQRGTPTETHHHALSQLSGVGSSAERGEGEIPGEERDKVGRQQYFVFSWHDQGGGGEETSFPRSGRSSMRWISGSHWPTLRWCTFHGKDRGWVSRITARPWNSVQNKQDQGDLAETVSKKVDKSLTSQYNPAP